MYYYVTHPLCACHLSFFPYVTELPPSIHRHIPLARSTSKLSKIETLRMARNYLFVLSETLSTGEAFDLASYANVMSRGMSQATANQINGLLNLRPHSAKVSCSQLIISRDLQ